MSIVEKELARIASQGSLAQWSSRACELALRAIGDTLAGGIAGGSEQQTRVVSTAFGLEEHVPALPLPSRDGSPPQAAYLSAVACHALDWNDYMLPMYGHCSTVLLPAAWSIAVAHERSGRELVEAFLVGYQIDYLASLLFGSAHFDHGWHATTTIGTIGAAATAARLLRLDAEAAGHALAIASGLAGGLKVNFGTDTEAAQVGAAARNGVEAALLARHGMVASPDWLCGRSGMLASFGGAVQPADAAAVWREIDLCVHGIETPAGVIQRLHTCCGGCHPALDAVIGLAREVQAAGRQVVDIEVHVDPAVPRLMGVEAPDSPAAATCSLTWAIAAAALDQAAGPAQFSRAALARRELHALRERVTVIADRQNTASSPFAARVVVRDGSTVRERSVTHALGDPSNPLSAEQLRAKQHQALDPVLGSQAAAAFIQALEGLLELTDLSTLARLAQRGRPDIHPSAR